MSLAFQGTAWALSSIGLAEVSAALGVHAPEIWALLAVETSCCGYLPDRRPQLLYERHIFHRLTGGRFDDGDISDPVSGGYGAKGSHQYDRLAEAVYKDREAALQSASWGLAQIMGENFAAAGFANVEEMMAAMMRSEDEQLAALASFLTAMNLHTALQAHDWTTFARRYNGPNFVINRYDVRLNAEYRKYSSGVLPDLEVRAVQLYLTYLGFHPGVIDGIAGRRTLSAMREFQKQKGLVSNSTIDPGVVTQLRSELEAIDRLPDAA